MRASQCGGTPLPLRRIHHQSQGIAGPSLVWTTLTRVGAIDDVRQAEGYDRARGFVRSELAWATVRDIDGVDSMLPIPRATSRRPDGTCRTTSRNVPRRSSSMSIDIADLTSGPACRPSAPPISALPTLSEAAEPAEPAAAQATQPPFADSPEAMSNIGSPLSVAARHATRSFTLAQSTSISTPPQTVPPDTPATPPSPPPPYDNIDATVAAAMFANALSLDIPPSAAAHRLSNPIAMHDLEAPPPYGAWDGMEMDIGPNHGISDPWPSIISPLELAHLLVQIFDTAHRSTRTFQAFYRTEFDHACARDPALLESIEAETLSAAFARHFAELDRVSIHGTHARWIRDLISLAVSGVLLTGVAIEIENDARASGIWHLDAYRHANTPFGDVRASWTLTGFEIGKALLTSALSYLTMPRHHVVDEWLTRYERVMGLLIANLETIDPVCAAQLKAAPPHAVAARASEIASEAGRNLSTIFTMINYLTAPVRLGLFAVDRLASFDDARRPAWMPPVAGLLRVVSSVSDTLRAVLSQVGTHGRQLHFRARMRALTRQAQVLDGFIDRIDAGAAFRAAIAQALSHTTLTTGMSSNGALEKMARFPALRAAVADTLDAPIGSLAHRLAPLALDGFGVEVGVGRPDERDAFAQPYRLITQRPEDHWGFVPQGRLRLMTPVRMVYRVSLTLQALGAAVIARFMRRA